MTRSEHMKWCKQRAMAEINFSGKPEHAVASMISDLGKHPETADMQTVAMMMAMTVKTPEEAKKFVEGFAE